MVAEKVRVELDVKEVFRVRYADEEGGGDGGEEEEFGYGGGGEARGEHGQLARGGSGRERWGSATQRLSSRVK